MIDLKQFAEKLPNDIRNSIKTLNTRYREHFIRNARESQKKKTAIKNA